MIYTLMGLAAAGAADLLLLMAAVRFGFMVQRRRMTSGVQAAPMDQIISQQDIFYRLFGARLTWQLVLLLICLAVVVFLLVFYLLTRRMTGEIRVMEKKVRRMAEGDFHIRLKTDQEGELARIASGINMLAAHVEEMQTAAEAAERTKNELITDVAHDLRSPLTSIIGYIDLVKNQGASLDESQKEKYLDIAYTKAEKLNHLIDDLFNLTKISYGQMPMEITRIDLISLLTQAVDEFYPVFEEHELECLLETDVRSCMIEADGDQLFRVFDNLLSNAVRYGNHGKKIRIRTHTGLDEITVHVINYGNIIPEESLPRLFDKFYKVDPSRNSESGGTGLGLAIAKSIVESHGGRIGVTSDFNGTDFIVTLPFEQDKDTAKKGNMDNE